jgi:hypothetical protein
VAHLTITEAACLSENKDISFIIADIQNGPTQIASAAFTSYWSTSEYQKVAEFKGTLTVANKYPGTLDRAKIFVEQVSKDYGVTNEYTIRFTPRNPIPKIGWV